jgi:uncharacterized protein YecT (DUF1311 family)
MRARVPASSGCFAMNEEISVCVPEGLDRDIATSFTQALAALSAADALRADQRAWLKTRDECGDLIHSNRPIYADVFACLREQMTARAAKLRAIVAAKQFPK